MDVFKLYANYKTFTLVIIGLLLSFFFSLANPFSLDDKSNKVVAIALLMILWWVTETLAMPVVALLPIVLFPMFGISDIKEATKPYADPIIFLFMGGFMLGLAIEKWNLHKRIALNIINVTGTSGNKIVLGFILSTGLLSMWLSNTATTMMMFPIALSVISVISHQQIDNKNLAAFSLTIMLAIAYSSNIGGVATIIGTPPNVAYVGYFNKHYGIELDFFRWMLLCMPLSILLLFCLYWVMVKWLFPNNINESESAKSFIKRELIEIGPITKAEKRVLVIFILTAFLWIFRSLINSILPFLKLDDTIIALICAISLFIVNAGETDGQKYNPILHWHDTSKLAWGILLLFGGGISLANALENAGLIQKLGIWLSQYSSNTFLLICFITILSIFISEVMSNVAQVIVFAPVVSALADALHINPLLFGIPMTLAASLAGMFPMGTPPNAIVFASGKIKFFEMVKVGFIMNIIAIILVVILTWYIIPLVFTN
jgi:sodium-dependent dicarboxylate transporter 2/3/5